MEWSIWLLAGLLLLLIELITPGGFYFIFFGIGALTVGVLAGFHVAGPGWFQLVLFALVSLGTLWLFRGKLLELAEGKAAADIDSLIGKTAVAVDRIAAKELGKVEMRGTSWTARNIGDQPLKRGERVRVERVEGLTLFVRPEST